MLRKSGRARLVAAAVSIAVVGLSACSTSTSTSSSSDGGTTSPSKEVVLVTHDSWAVPKGLLADFTQKTGYTVKVLKAGDAGELTNKLVLTKAHPIGDAVYGIDNTFASRAVDAGVLSDYASPASTADVDRYRLAADPNALTPIDWGDVCVNIDDTWFADHKIAPPSTWQDLTDPTYKGMLVTEGATTSSTGLAFLLATIAEFGEDGAFSYWKDLLANGVKIDPGWEEAYFSDFSGGGDGDRPIVVSYNSSPPYTIPKKGDKPTTSALLDTCFRQVEYAGVLAGANNPEGAKALVDFLLSDSFQSILPENMYVFPVRSEIPLPPVWAKWAPVTDTPLTLDPAEIAAKRDAWLKRWVEVTNP